MREKGRTWASDESEGHVLMGRVFQYLEVRGFSGCSPREREAPSFPKCLGSGQEYKPGAGVGHAGGGGGPPKVSRAQMLDFCFFIILPSICEGQCIWAQRDSVCIWRPERKGVIINDPIKMDQDESQVRFWLITHG